MAYLSKEQQVRSFKPHKTKHKKKPKNDGKTPLPEGKKICSCDCGKTKYLSIHHVFYGTGQKRLSNRFKCVEWLCYEKHQGNHQDEPGYNQQYKSSRNRKHIEKSCEKYRQNFSDTNDQRII